MQIEPSIKGGELITEMIAHVVKNFDFYNHESKFFYKKGGEIYEEENDGSKWEIK